MKSVHFFPSLKQARKCIKMYMLVYACRVFSLNFWWGDSKFLAPVEDRRGRSLMGGGNLWKKSNWSQNCPPNAKLGLFCYFKHEVQLFKILLSLKVVKFDTKCIWIFQFLGRTSTGGGQALVQKRGQVSDGGIDKIFVRWGPQSPQKKPWHVNEFSGHVDTIWDRCGNLGNTASSIGKELTPDCNPNERQTVVVHFNSAICGWILNCIHRISPDYFRTSEIQSC